ncbi:hypothetical protein B0H11DRAFT_2244833 [Mycena galericulata]|nr:hypothetical protein B0H11DRAFT_2244833 [Mycena galericulata]
MTTYLSISTNEMIDTLILITQILFLALNVGLPDRTIWQPFHQLVGKLYVNSILASLNVRRVVLGKGDPVKSTHSGLSRSTTVGGPGSTKMMPLAFMPKTDTSETFDTRDADQDRYQLPDQHSQCDDVSDYIDYIHPTKLSASQKGENPRHGI